MILDCCYGMTRFVYAKTKAKNELNKAVMILIYLTLPPVGLNL